jgi:hypothetical protein
VLLKTYGPDGGTISASSLVSRSTRDGFSTLLRSDLTVVEGALAVRRGARGAT